MKFITDSNELCQTFQGLCKNYKHYRWSVAWAGEVSGFDLADLLDVNKAKIDKIVIGLHFYQTSPNFIDRYKGNSAVRFIKKTDGIFHSKVYLFYNSGKEWAALVGSSNFTQSGFHCNEEANILLTTKDGDETLFPKIFDYIGRLWNYGQYFNADDFKAYKDSSKYQKRKLDNLRILSVNNKTNMTSAIDIKSWRDFVADIIIQDRDIDERIRLLKTAHKLFQAGNFNKLSQNERQCLAGIASTLDNYYGESINWKIFGSMQGAGTFKHAIINKQYNIGTAIDNIPLTGPVTKQQFDSYCQAFNAWTNPIACATRLLAIKRPDIFVCIDSKNRLELSRMMKISQSHFTLQNYWSEVIERIHNCAWYNDSSPKVPGIESDIWEYRVAMLDSICYKEE